MNEDDFKITPNAAKLLAEIELESAVNRVQWDAMRRAGKTDEEIVEAVTAEADGFKWMYKGMTVVTLLIAMGAAFGMGQTPEEQMQGEDPIPMQEWKNQAFVCYAAGQRGLVDSPLYKRWDAMFTFASTVEAVWIYFMQENLLTGTDLSKLTGFDYDFFMEMLKTPLDQAPIFALNADDQARKKARKEQP